MITLYVEGGGHLPETISKFRLNFASLLSRAGINPREINVVPSGGRKFARNSFELYLQNNEIHGGNCAFLVVDSESRVPDIYMDRPWDYLTTRINDEEGLLLEVHGAYEVDCHLMVQCMDAWFLADIDTLEVFFGEGFNREKLRDCTNIEQIPKRNVEIRLKAAVRRCTNETFQAYNKIWHGCQLLNLVDPARIEENSPWARRFFDTLRERTNAA